MKKGEKNQKKVQVIMARFHGTPGLFIEILIDGVLRIYLFVQMPANG
jgi:hypothetical protein